MGVQRWCSDRRPWYLHDLTRRSEGDRIPDAKKNPDANGCLSCHTDISRAGRPRPDQARPAHRIVTAHGTASSRHLGWAAASSCSKRPVRIESSGACRVLQGVGLVGTCARSYISGAQRGNSSWQAPRCDGGDITLVWKSTTRIDCQASFCSYTGMIAIVACIAQLKRR